MVPTSNEFSAQLSEMGLPSEAGELMLGAIRRAGFDPSQESERFAGLAALTSALRIHEAATRVVSRSRGRVGRNDPCPCGSGRKFKKCCQGKGESAERPAEPPFPLDCPDLVPRLNRPEHFAEDMGALDRLFGNDPGLRRIRFDAGEVLRFVAEELEDDPEEEPTAGPPEAETPDEDRRGRLEAWVVRYLREVEGDEAPGNLERAFLAAAPRRGHSAADLRALALGLALAGMPADEGEGGEVEANPLHTLIFRRTLQEAVATQEVIEALVAETSLAEGVDEEEGAADQPEEEE